MTDISRPASCAGLARFLSAAIERSRAKTLRIRLLTSKNEPVVLSWTAPATFVDVTDDDGRSYGTIDLRSGDFRPAGIVVPDGLFDLLQSLSERPAAVARAYGRATGQCCFCHRRLTDPRSVEAGYGPVCANRYGLPWG